MFRFVEACLAKALPDLENALEVSFVEDFALAGFSQEHRAAVLDRLSRPMADRLKRCHDGWKM